MGAMIMNKVYVVLPKITTYIHKEEKWKRWIESNVNQWVLNMNDLKLDINCFLEDDLAYELLKEEKEISWVSVLGTADCNFIRNYSPLYFEKYETVNCKKVTDSLIVQARKKYKPPTNHHNELEYSKARLAVLNNRMRYIVNKVLEVCPFVVYVDSGNSYCSPPASHLGDGKMVIKVNVISGITTYMFGGIPISEEDYKRIIQKESYGSNI